MNQEYMTLDEIHQELLGMLQDFHKLCNQLDIKYFLSGGSLLGAIRHQGFIPWDDDLDIMMLREDYVKLIENREQLDGKYRLSSLETVSDWQYPFAKIDLISTYIDDEYRDVQHGLFIDIFPIDNLPDDPERQNEICKKIRRLDFLRGSGTKKAFRPSEKHRVIKNLIKPYANVLGPNYFARKINRLALKINQENQQSNTMGVAVVSTHGTKEFLSAKAFSQAVEVSFEKEIATIPIGYEEYLGNLYGDYMQLPPEKDRIPAHYKILRK
ncbi:phosphorylcholine transferase LicD [Enterococcus florum]|uniref:Phosphorylcholine transferase LicD n=1 Tax=Enterococcus florum TaxID=2480627 RepID=A0A4P5PBR4_9ENTE|nr:LicD family protein [Enterococcus florum]GCF93914.1 phosphorylcholine transferase LicD [Enterococcus florum]